MAACVDKMNKECKKIPLAKGRKVQNGKNLSISENDGVIEGCITSPSPAVLSVMEDEADKENRHITPKHGGRRKKILGNVSSNSDLSLQEELEAARLRLQKLNIEKQETEKLLEERDALLKEKEVELQLKGEAQERLQLELKKLQKLKEFKPTLSLSLEQSLRMTELAKEKDRKKKKNDSNFPRKPLPPYILWCSDQWNQVKSENPDAVFKDIASILGLKWKDLGAEGKKPYEEKYQAEKEAYLQAVGQKRRETEGLKLLHKEQKQKHALELLEQYLQYKKDAEEEKRSKKRKEKDPLKPKHPVTAFFAFSNERRDALLAEKHNVLEIAKILGDEWRSMTKEARLPYEQAAAQAREHYMQEMELYKQRKAEEANSVSKEEAEHRKVEQEQALQLLRKKEREETLRKNMKESRQQRKQMKEKTSDPNRPKKPPTSFIIFSKETRKKLAQEQPGRSNPIMNALVSIKWKELGEAEKKIWHDQAAIAMMQYKKDMEEYNKSKKEETKHELEPELPKPSPSTITC